MKKYLWIAVLILSACATRQPLHGTAIDDMASDLHEGIHHNKTLQKSQGSNVRELSEALMPELRLHKTLRIDYSKRRFNITANNMPAATFYSCLVKNTPINMIVSPKIKGNITVNLKKVTLEQALQIIENTYGYTYNTIPGGYEIIPKTLQTKIYAINYLQSQRTGKSEMRLHSGEVTENVPMSQTQSALSAPISSGAAPVSVPGNIGNVSTDSVIDFWGQLKSTLINIIGTTEDRSVTVNPLAGVVVVRAYPRELKQVEAYLDLVQNNMNRQILLEAKVLEVTLNDNFQMGIDWQTFATQAQAISVPGEPTTNSQINGPLVRNIQLSSLGTYPKTTISSVDLISGYGGTLRWGNDFISSIRLLGTQGNVQVLSSPHVATMNNQQSLIKVGNDEFYVSAISSGQASGLAVSQPTDVITPFFSGITLDVTPQIDVHGDIILHVHPSVSLVTEQVKYIHAGGTTPSPTPLAQSTIRESDTIVRAKNGQVIIIGGLMQNQTKEQIAELPFFGNIPFIGTLVRATQQASVKSELVILIKATVIDTKANNELLHEKTQHLRSLKRGFHIGGRPDIFGTEGERPITLGPKDAVYNEPHEARYHCKKGSPGCAPEKQMKYNMAEK